MPIIANPMTPTNPWKLSITTGIFLNLELWMQSLNLLRINYQTQWFHEGKRTKNDPKNTMTTPIMNMNS